MGLKNIIGGQEMAHGPDFLHLRSDTWHMVESADISMSDGRIDVTECGITQVETAVFVEFGVLRNSGVNLV